jgi:hypothetical protein
MKFTKEISMTALHPTLLLLTAVLTLTPLSHARPLPWPSYPPPTPIMVGTWYLFSRNCTSNAEVRDGLELGKDTVEMIYRPDFKFEERIVRKGCETVTTGTYTTEGRKITTTAMEAKNCKNPEPLPVKEIKTTFMAYLDENESLTVTTGEEARQVCPEGDAFVRLYSKIIIL